MHGYVFFQTSVLAISSTRPASASAALTRGTDRDKKTLQSSLTFKNVKIGREQRKARRTFVNE